jgi:hypothetical protein
MNEKDATVIANDGNPARVLGGWTPTGGVQN